MPAHGRYDELMPIACGVIDDVVTREVVLDPVNDSVIAGTARLALSGSNLYVWLSLGGPIAGHPHLQHIHVPEGNARGSCPTPALDRNHDGLVSLEEGVPAYGPPAVSLEPFPEPTGLTFEYSRILRVPPKLPLDRAVVVVHGMEVAGKFDGRFRSRAAPSIPTPRCSAHRRPAPASAARARATEPREASAASGSTPRHSAESMWSQEGLEAVGAG